MVVKFPVYLNRRVFVMAYLSPDLEKREMIAWLVVKLFVLWLLLFVLASSRSLTVSVPNLIHFFFIIL